MSVQKKKKVKAAITDEVWTDERIKMFLDVEPVEGTDADFHRLLKAYQSMRADDFEKFIGFFKEAGGNLSATNPQGQTLSEVIKPHRHSDDYSALLK